MLLDVHEEGPSVHPKHPNISITTHSVTEIFILIQLLNVEIFL